MTQNSRNSQLAKQFAKANLKVVFSARPFGSSANKDVFGITITRKIKGVARSEVFSVWLGSEDNRVEVVNTDPARCQLVLMVQEARREVAQWLSRHDADQLLRFRGIVRESIKKNADGSIDFKTFSPANKRHMLMGVDERQLFIAQLPRGITTVESAHKSLKTTSVTLAEGKVPVDEIKAIEKGIRDNRLFVLKKTAIGRVAGVSQGHPHMADEIVTLPGKILEHGFSVRSRPDIFVRGKVRHVDHKTVSFKQWRKVIKNSEAAATTGVNWVD